MTMIKSTLSPYSHWSSTAEKPQAMEGNFRLSASPSCKSQAPCRNSKAKNYVFPSFGCSKMDRCQGAEHPDVSMCPSSTPPGQNVLS